MPIGELTKKLDIQAHTLRYWEKEFPSLIAPIVGAGRRRFYRQETIDNIFALKKYLYAEGYTIDGVKKLIATGGFNAAPTEMQKPAAPTGEGIPDAIDLLEQAKKILE
jgi:DNA-binding transcriptional MerR regulator